MDMPSCPAGPAGNKSPIIVEKEKEKDFFNR